MFIRWMDGWVDVPTAATVIVLMTYSNCRHNRANRLSSVLRYCSFGSVPLQRSAEMLLTASCYRLSNRHFFTDFSSVHILSTGLRSSNIAEVQRKSGKHYGLPRRLFLCICRVRRYGSSGLWLELRDFRKHETSKKTWMVWGFLEMLLLIAVYCRARRLLEHFSGHCDSHVWNLNSERGQHMAGRGRSVAVHITCSLSKTKENLVDHG